MSYLELVNGYKARLDAAGNKTAEAGRILQEIDHLVYEETFEPVSDADRVRILKDLSEADLTCFKESEESFNRYAQDNEEYLALIEMAIREAEGK